MTSYYLSLGYQASHPYIPIPKNREEYDNSLWSKLKECIYDVCTKTEKLKSDILALGFKKLECHNEIESVETLDECLVDLSESFRSNSNSELYPGIDNMKKKIVFDTNCQTKYQVYRAVIRNVMLEMHKIGIEISVEVH
jgi:hypothetical protein